MKVEFEDGCKHWLITVYNHSVIMTLGLAAYGLKLQHVDRH